MKNPGDRFEKGQLVYCVATLPLETGLTIGKGYKVEWIGGDCDEEWTGVKNDQGNIKGYYAYLFSDLKPVEGSINSSATKRPLEEEDFIVCFLKSVLDKDTEELMVGRIYYLHHIAPLANRKIKVRRLGGSVIEAFFPIEWFREATPEDFKTMRKTIQNNLLLIRSTTRAITTKAGSKRSTLWRRRPRE